MGGWWLKFDENGQFGLFCFTKSIYVFKKIKRLIKKTCD